MKLLTKLRELAGVKVLESEPFDLTYDVTPVDAEAFEIGEVEEIEVEPLAADPIEPVYEGLRRRIPDIHEEIPPTGLAVLDETRLDPV